MTKNLFTRFSILAIAFMVVSSTWSVMLPKTEAAASESYTWRNVVTGAGGGFIPGIIFNKTEPNLIYARTDIGGAYRWNQADSSWIPLLDSIGWEDWNKTGVDALATDPVDTNRLYLAVGTYTNSWDPNNGAIMRSTDKGATWQSTPLPFKVGGNMPGRNMGERLAIDPNKNNILYFGARSGNGLWKSTDYGVTWNKVTNFPNPGTYIADPNDEWDYLNDIMGLTWITFDPSTGSSGSATQTIYVGVADKGNSIYRSTDGGQTWSAVPGQPTGFIPHHGEISNGNLYITYSDTSGPYDGSKGDVYKLNLATSAWTNISPVPSTSTDLYYGYGGLAVDVQHPDTIMVSALNSWWPDTIFFRSTDAGATWTRIWDWESYPSRTMRYTQDISAAPWLDFGTTPQAPEVTPKLGWMVGDIEIDPFNSDRLMYGTGATIYGSNNLTNWDNGTKINISVMAKGIEEMAVNDLISPPSGAPLLSAVADVSGFRHTDLTVSPTKMFVNPSSTTSLDYAELSPSFIARVGSGDYANNPNAKSISISNDGGGNWYTVSEPSGTKGGGKIAVSADGSSMVWSTSDKGVYRSAGGYSWTASTGIPANAKIASDRVNKNKFYGYAAGNFYISTDAGVSFTQTAAVGLPTEGVANFKAMPGVEGDIWFAGGNTDGGVYGLWHSTNGGASFTKLSNVQEADVIGFGKAAPGQTYMALYTSAKIDNKRGIYRSIDAGATWIRVNDDQHQYGVTNSAITGDPRVYGRVYVGTNGRGIVYGDTNSTTIPPITNNSTITPTSASFDKKTANQADVAVTMTLNGNTLSAIKNGSAVLTAGTDYTVASNVVTIKKSYLAAQAVGMVNLTFDFSAGNDPILTVSVVDTTSAVDNSSITPTSASFDKKTGNQADVAVTMTLNGNTLSAIKNGSAVLTAGTDYTVAGNIVTIKSSYLAAQAASTVNLTFDFSAGTDPVLAVSVVDTTAQPAGALKVQMYNGTTAGTANTINPKIKLVNTGTTSINLADVKLRYYYTIDGATSQGFWCDWATVGSANITNTFVTITAPKTSADTYAEFGFSSAAGTLAVGQSIELQIRIAKSDWSNYTQTGDYSFNSTAISYVDWNKVTGYVSGNLQWGIEP